MFRLIDIAGKLKLPTFRVVELLGAHGFSIENKPLGILTNTHIDALSSVYVNSVEAFFKRFKSNREKYDEIGNERLINFFSHFISDEDFLYGVYDIENFKLNKFLIEEHFFRIIGDEKAYIVRRVNFKECLSFSVIRCDVITRLINLKSLFLSIITPGLFGIFVDEDDNYGYAQMKIKLLHC